MHITICKTDDQCKCGLCIKQSTQSQCSDVTQGDKVGREVGREVEGGYRMGGTHVYPWLIHVSVWQNHHNIVK